MTVSRILPEMDEAAVTYEWTVTYDPLFATKLREESKRHVQLAVKRARKYGYVFKYFAAPEPHKSGILHWHILVFFRIKPTQPLAVLRKDFHRFWNLGRTSFSLPRSGSRLSNYVANYALKVGNLALQSNGLGRETWNHAVGDYLHLLNLGFHPKHTPHFLHFVPSKALDDGAVWHREEGARASTLLCIPDSARKALNAGVRLVTGVDAEDYFATRSVPFDAQGVPWPENV